MIISTSAFIRGCMAKLAVLDIDDSLERIIAAISRRVATFLQRFHNRVLFPSSNRISWFLGFCLGYRCRLIRSRHRWRWNLTGHIGSRDVRQRFFSVGYGGGRTGFNWPAALGFLVSTCEDPGSRLSSCISSPCCPGTRRH